MDLELKLFCQTNISKVKNKLWCLTFNLTQVRWSAKKCYWWNNNGYWAHRSTNPSPTEKTPWLWHGIVLSNYCIQGQEGTLILCYLALKKNIILASITILQIFKKKSFCKNCKSFLSYSAEIFSQIMLTWKYVIHTNTVTCRQYYLTGK